MKKKVGLLILFLCLSGGHRACAALPGYSGHATVTVDNTANASALSDYPVSVTVNTAYLIAAGEMQADAADIRFLDSDDATPLSFWVDPDTIDTAATRIWVKVPSIPASSSKDIHFYYDNPGAASASDGGATFDAFVNFTVSGVVSYGGPSQDQEPAGTTILSDYTLRMEGNNWKAVPLATALNNDLELDYAFRSAGETGEINGIGFDTETSGLNENWFYKTFGTQNWGLSGGTVYSGSGGIETISVPLDDFTGNFTHLVFTNDADAGQATDVYYRYVRLRKRSVPEPAATVNFPVSRIDFTTSPQELYVDIPSQVYTIQTRDFTTSPKNVSADTTVSLASTAATGEFSLTRDPWNPVNAVTVSAGTNSADFYYRDSAAGSPTITAAEAPPQGWTDATQAATVEESGTYSTPVVLDSASALVDYQVRVTLNTEALVNAGRMEADGSDLRVFDSDHATELPFWIKPSTMNTSNTEIWVRVPIVPAGEKTIYLDYGNFSLTQKSSGKDTFITYVDFSTDGVFSYGGAGQDREPLQVAVEDGGETLHMEGNNWKASGAGVTLDGNQRLDFDFKSDGELGEINGVGFDTELSGLNPNWFYTIQGTQPWGDHAAAPPYSQSGDFEAIGADLDDFTGTFSYLVFSNDADAGQNTNVYYRYVRIRKYGTGEPDTDPEFPLEKVAFASDPQSILEDRVSDAITVQAQDIGGTPREVGEDLAVALSSSSGTGAFSLAASPFSPVSSVTIPAGSHSVDVYYRDGTPGTHTLSAVPDPASGLDPGTQPIEVIEVTVDYQYRVPVTITSTQELADYQVLVVFDTATPIAEGKMRADAADIRFLDSDGAAGLSFWMHPYTVNTGGTRLWVKVPSIPAGTKTIYLEYGNPAGVSLSSGADTFIDFVNFADRGVQSYGGSSQDRQPTLFDTNDDGGHTLHLFGNSWKAVDVNLATQTGTKLDFDFRSSAPEAEINGIGFDTETSGLNSNWFYKAYGTQNWGTSPTDPVYGGSGGFERLGRVLDDFPGSFDYLVLNNDKDAGAVPDVYYRFVRVRKYSTPEPLAVVGAENVLISRLRFTSPSQTLVQDEISDALVVRAEDAAGDPVAVLADTALDLSSSAASGRFSADDAVWSDTTQVIMPAGQSTVTFYYRDGVAGSPILRAEEFPSMGWSAAEQEISIAQRRIVFVTAPQVLLQDAVSSRIAFQTHNAAGSPVPVTDATDFILETTSSSGEFSAAASPFAPVTRVQVGAGATGGEFYYRDAAIGAFTLSVREDPGQGWLAAQQAVTVQPATDYFLVEAPPAVYAEEPFTLEIRAYKQDGTLFTGYEGTVELEIEYENPGEGTAFLSRENASGFSEGVLALGDLEYADAGEILIRVRDASFPEVEGSVSVEFFPRSFDISAEPDQAAGRAFPLAIRALGARGNPTPNFIRTVNLEAVPGEPVNVVGAQWSPASVELPGGTAETGFVYNRWGEIRVRVTDPDIGEYAGLDNASLSDSIRVHPASFAVSIAPPPPDRDFFYLDERFDLTVSALDAAGEALPNYGGTIRIESPGALNVPERYRFLPDDRGVHVFEVFGAQDGDHAITVADTDYSPASGGIEEIPVREARILVESKTVPVGITRVALRIVDAGNTLVEEDNATIFTVTLQESNPDGSAFSEAQTASVTVKNGTGIFFLRDSQPEEVEVRVESDPEIPSDTGTIRFTTDAVELGEGGMRIDYWKESRGTGKGN